MVIEKLEIKGFGRLNNTIFELGKGFNLVFGPNEAGKSTLQYFIKAMLYGLKGGRPARDGLLPPLRRYRPWNGGEFGGVLQYRLEDGRRFRAERNFESGSVRVYDEYFNDITEGFPKSRERGTEFAEAHLGLNETCFERTVFIGQLGTRFDDEGGKELANRLINISNTGFEELSLRNAEKALREALLNDIGTDRSVKRPLDRLEERIKELKAQRASLMKSRQSAAENEGKLKEAAGAVKRLAEEKRQLTRFMELLEIKGDVEKDRKLESSLRQALDEITARAEEHGRSAGAGGSVKAAGAVSAGFILIASALLLYSLFAKTPSFFPPVSAFLGAAAAGFYFIYLKIKQKALYARQRQEQENELRDIYSAVSILYGKQITGADDLMKAAEETGRRAGQAQAGLEAAVAAELAAAGGFGALPGGNFAGRRMTEAELKRLEASAGAALAAVEERYREALLDRREYETRLESEASAGPSLQTIEEELEELEKRKKELEDKGFALRKALEVLTEAGSELQKEFLPALYKSMSGIMGSLTGGKYRELRADESLTLKALPPETGQVTPALLLSGGTCDQAYLALRLAAAELLGSGERRLPVFLDEPFSQYDDSRTLQALTLLSELAKDRQIVLFTCKEREKELAAGVCGGSIKITDITDK